MAPLACGGRRRPARLPERRARGANARCRHRGRLAEPADLEKRARLAQHYAPFRRLAVESDLVEKHHRVLLWAGYGAKPLIAVSFEEDPAIDAAQSRPWENMYYECPSDEERLKPERVRVYVGGIGRVLVRGFKDDATLAASLRAAVDTCGAAVPAPKR